MNHISDGILLFFQNINIPFFNSIFYFFTKIVEPKILLILVCLFYWNNKEKGKKIAIVFFFSGILVQFFKVLFKIERPFVRNKEIHAYDKAVLTATGYSFPSGHTQAATSIFLSFNKYKKNILFILLIFLVGLSRIVLRVHNVYDVIFSIILTYIIYKIVFEVKNNDYLMNTILFISFISIIYTMFNKTIISKEKIDIFKTFGGFLGFYISFYLDEKIKKLPNKITENIHDYILSFVYLILFGLVIVLFERIFPLKGVYIFEVIKYSLNAFCIFYAIPYLVMKNKKRL